MHEVQVDIDACPEHAWAVLADVARWPEWSGAVTAATALDGGPMVLGGGVRVHARRLGRRTWRVTALARHRGFTWSCGGAASTDTLTVRIARIDDDPPPDDPPPDGAPRHRGSARATAVAPRRTRVTMVLDRTGPAVLAALRPGGTRGAADVDALAADLRRECERRRGSAVGPAPRPVTHAPVHRPA